MILNDIYTIWLREMIRFLRAKSRLVSSLAMPFFWLVFIGVGIGSTVKIPGIDYIDFLVPGILGMILLFNSIFSGVSVIWDRQFGFLKEILVAPVSRTSVFIGKVFGGATVAMVTAFIMFAVTLILGMVKPSLGIFAAVMFMVLIAICFVSIGVIIASRMRNMEGFQVIMSFLVMPLFFLSGALFPLQNTPLWMQTISHLDPLTYGVDGLRGSLLGQSIYPIWLNFAAMLVFTAVFAAVGSQLFRKSTI